MKGRCRATNLCPYCRTLYTVETHEMLMLDALSDSPTCWVVLTAREHLTRRDTYRHLEQLRRAAKRRWPRIEWHVQVEFQRRGALHLNVLVKGVPASDADELGALLIARWCERVDAHAAGQWVGAIEDGHAVSRYLAKTLAHGLKAEQAPPIGWRGHRTSQTRGYFPDGAAAAREAARASLRSKRALHRVLDAGLSGEIAELELELQAERAERETWELVGVIETVGDLVVAARGVKRRA